MLENTDGLAFSLKEKKSTDLLNENELSMVLGGKTYEQLAEDLVDIQDNQYGKITLDASFLSRPISDVFERKRKMDNFYFLIALIRLADKNADIKVMIPNEEDTDIIERILQSGADRTELTVPENAGQINP